MLDPSVFVTANPACPDNGDGTASWSVAFRDAYGASAKASGTQKIGTTVAQAPVRLAKFTMKYSVQVTKSPGYVAPGRTDVNCLIVNTQRCTFAGVCVSD